MGSNCCYRQTNQMNRSSTFVHRAFGPSPRTHFFDVKVFYPFASSYSSKSLPSPYRRHDQQKRREYNQSVREIEHSGFMLLVFPQLTGWLRKRPYLSSDWLVFFHRNEMRVILPKWAGSVASHCFAFSVVVTMCAGFAMKRMITRFGLRH